MRYSFWFNPYRKLVCATINFDEQNDKCNSLQNSARNSIDLYFRPWRQYRWRITLDKVMRSDAKPEFDILGDFPTSSQLHHEAGTTLQGMNYPHWLWCDLCSPWILIFANWIEALIMPGRDMTFTSGNETEKPIDRHFAEPFEGSVGSHCNLILAATSVHQQTAGFLRLFSLG